MCSTRATKTQAGASRRRSVPPQHAYLADRFRAACFPEAFEEAASSTGARPAAIAAGERAPERLSAAQTGADVHSALCMVLHVCCRQQPERLVTMCSGPGTKLIAHLLCSSEETLCATRHEPQSTSAAEWLLFLLGEVCACGQRFMQLYTSLGDEPAGASSCSASGPRQALLLHAAAGAAEIRESASRSADEEQQPAVRFLQVSPGASTESSLVSPLGYCSTRLRFCCS